jgi:hypothetical protein
MKQVTDYKGSERRNNKVTDRRSPMKQYFQGFIIKLMENLSSAKIWFFLLPFVASTVYMGWIILEQVDLVKTLVARSIDDTEILNSIEALYKVASDTFNAWCVFTVSLSGTVIVVRETFKVSKLRALNESENETTEREIEQVSI